MKLKLKKTKMFKLSFQVITFSVLTRFERDSKVFFRPTAPDIRAQISLDIIETLAICMVEEKVLTNYQLRQKGRRRMEIGFIRMIPLAKDQYTKLNVSLKTFHFSCDMTERNKFVLEKFIDFLVSRWACFGSVLYVANDKIFLSLDIFYESRSPTKFLDLEQECYVRSLNK